MSEIIWIALVALAILVLVAVLLTYKAKKNKKQKPDYYAFFVMGLIWTITGPIIWALSFFAEGMPSLFSTPLFPVGVVFLVVGLANKNKWNKRLPSIEKRNRLLLAATALILIGVLAAVSLLV
ncbi:MAG: hypothetical protein ABIH90_01945 [Candidatus Aenigmatarchaeota archaeon]